MAARTRKITQRSIRRDRPHDALPLAHIAAGRHEDHNLASQAASPVKPTLSDLRTGVERALQALGGGLLQHPDNAPLRESLRDGRLTPAGFHNQLLRVIYRLIFLFAAEDRTLDGTPVLHPPDSTDTGRQARARYLEHASANRLRTFAGEFVAYPHDDLWRRFNDIVGALSGDPGFAAARDEYALPILGSVLWSPSGTPDLNAPSHATHHGCELTNADFLKVIRHLAFVHHDQTPCPIDFQNLGSSELGGIYEGLLALTPQISADGTRFTFAEIRDNHRKTSGSFYTPDSLIQRLLDSALDPVVADAIRGKSAPQAESAILNLRICDPACGSGHFLIGAAHRLALHLARVRSHALGESTPSPSAHQHALREVIRNCIYGVDLNPMAVELCKVALWMESMEPGKPLTFLDAHIKCGNALLGATPALISGGIPDDAFEPLDSDNKSVVLYYKKRNRRERNDRDSGRQTLLGEPDGLFHAAPDTAPALLNTLAAEPEDDEHAMLVANAWCAAFVWRKHDTDSAAAVPGLPGKWDALTDRIFRDIQRDPRLVRPWIKDEVARLATDHRFFHWHLEFPEVFADPDSPRVSDHHNSSANQSSRNSDKAGFDVILGNPPFLNQLEVATSTARVLARIIEMRSSGVIRGYTDVSAAFLLLSAQITRRGGRIALVQPQSLLAVKDAAPVRSAVLRLGSLESLWVSNEHVFEGASVYTCAPTIHIGGPRQSALARSTGAAFLPLPPTPLDSDALANQETWAHLAAAATGIPDFMLPDSNTLASIAEATADFRDQYYGLDGFLIDDAHIPADQRADFAAFPPIVTTGLIDLALCRWGEASTRILKTKWSAPRIDRARMDSSGTLGPWIRARLIPKILLATQTRIIEVFADPTGRYVPGIPLITITAKHPDRLWQIAAAIASPVCSALAMQRYAGAALSADAIKLSAKQVLSMPLPTVDADWNLAAIALELAHTSASAADRRNHLMQFGRHMCKAYGLSDTSTQAVMNWWTTGLESARSNRAAPRTERRLANSRRPSAQSLPKTPVAAEVA